MRFCHSFLLPGSAASYGSGKTEACTCSTNCGKKARGKSGDRTADKSDAEQ